MSKSRPTGEERLVLSVEARKALISRLEQLLRSMSAGGATEQTFRLQTRIAELRWRNSEPQKYLGHGNSLYRKFKFGGSVATGGW